MSILARIEAETPPNRDRYLDALRVLAIFMVVVGHWLVRVALATEDGPEGRYLLALVPALDWLTLLWQVMPLFFLIGGLVHAQSWRRARASGATPAEWVRRRARSLLRPMLALLAILAPVAGLVHWRAGPEVLIFDFGVMVIPLWFLAVYVAVAALAPFTLALHERGLSPWLIAGATGLAVLLDMLRFTQGGPMIGTQPGISAPNFLLVWVAIHQLGYLWADGRLPHGTAGQLGLAAVGLVALAVMIGSGLYPVSMVPIGGTTLPNNGSPPSAALIALALVQAGLALALRGPASRALQSPAVWAPFGLAGAQLISLYLWHQPVMVALANILYPRGWFPLTEALDLTWWLLRIPWVALCMLVLALVVIAVQPLTAPPRHPVPERGGPLLTGIGVIAVAVGIPLLILDRMATLFSVPALALIILGMAALGVFGNPARRGRE